MILSANGCHLVNGPRTDVREFGAGVRPLEGRNLFLRFGADCAMMRVPPEDSMRKRRLTNAELAEIRRRRPGVRASLACEGMYLTAEEEALFQEMEQERLTADERAARITQLSRARRRQKTPA
jgi:hypothetical protein